MPHASGYNQSVTAAANSMSLPPPLGWMPTALRPVQDIDDSMDVPTFSRNAAAANHNDWVSSLDLLEEESLREASQHPPQWTCDRQLLVEGAPAVTAPREVSRSSPRKPSVASKAPGARRPSTGRSNNNAEVGSGSRRQLHLENERLQREAVQWQREVEHVLEEKRELEASFRRLDQEIGEGYSLTERKEKELRIAELVTKNQKMSKLLEKELQSHEELRRAHSELQTDQKKLQEQVTLLNQVLSSTESKHAAASSAHSTLTASYEAAQATIETLQSEVHELQDKLITSGSHTQQFADYEAKIQAWELQYRGIKRKYDQKTQKLLEAQQVAQRAQQEAESARHRHGELEAEVRNAHDQLIRTNAAMRTMEAKLESNLQFGGNAEALNRRLRHLETELLEKNHAHAELTQTCNQLLRSRDPEQRSGRSKLAHSARNGQAMASRVVKLNTRIATLTDKLRDVEKARDRKTRSLSVLLQAFPFLLHRLDALQDRFAAAVESNDILKSALEQMQEPAVATSKLVVDSEGHVAFSSAGMSGSMYVQLAREKYLLAAPYPLELLTDLSGAQAFNDQLEVKSMAAKKKFAPFRIVTKVAKLGDNQYEDELPGDQSQQLVVLAADPSDTSGASYLNRSKVNAFLEVIQSRAARSKFKSLVVGKLADCLNKLRELAHRSASEAAVQHASIQMLQREVLELQHRMKRQPSSVDSNNHDSVAMTAGSSADAHKRRQFLLKIVDVYVEKQQRDDLRQSTFLTQPLSSDMLITKTQGSLNHVSDSSDDRLCLTESELDDEDVEQLLLKIRVSGVRFREIWLDANNLTDLGVQHAADFLEKCSPSVRILSLTRNKRITRHGIEMTRRGLVRNHRVQRVEELKDDSKRTVTLHGFAVQPEFDVSGNATEVIRVILPAVQEGEAVVDPVEMEPATTDQAVDAMTEKLRQLGFTYNVRLPVGASRQRSASFVGDRRRAPSHTLTTQPRTASTTAAGVPSRLASISSGGGGSTAANSRRLQIKKQQELRFQSLEAAIRRASAPHQSFSRGIGGRATVSSNRRTFGKAHVDMVRGLKQ